MTRSRRAAEATEDARREFRRLAAPKATNAVRRGRDGRRPRRRRRRRRNAPPPSPPPPWRSRRRVDARRKPPRRRRAEASSAAEARSEAERAAAAAARRLAEERADAESRRRRHEDERVALERRAAARARERGRGGGEAQRGETRVERRDEKTQSRRPGGGYGDAGVAGGDGGPTVSTVSTVPTAVLAGTGRVRARRVPVVPGWFSGRTRLRRDSRRRPRSASRSLRTSVPGIRPTGRDTTGSARVAPPRPRRRRHRPRRRRRARTLDRDRGATHTLARGTRPDEASAAGNSNPGAVASPRRRESAPRGAAADGGGGRASIGDARGRREGAHREGAHARCDVARPPIHPRGDRRKVTETSGQTQTRASPRGWRRWSRRRARGIPGSRAAAPRSGVRRAATVHSTPQRDVMR